MTEDFFRSITPAEIALVALKKTEMDGGQHLAHLALTVEFEKNLPIAMELLWQAFQVLDEAKRKEQERMRPIRQKEVEEWRAQAKAKRERLREKSNERGKE